MYHPMNIKDMQDMAPFINWRDHFEDAFRHVKRKISDKERVVVYAPEYLTKLSQIVIEYNSTVEGKMYVWLRLAIFLALHSLKIFQFQYS